MNSAPIPPATEALASFVRILRQLARTHGLRPDDAEDFVQSVQLRLIERDYDIFRRFEGRSSFRTYLVVVGTRLLLDWRNQTCGDADVRGLALRSPVRVFDNRTLTLMLEK